MNADGTMDLNDRRNLSVLEAKLEDVTEFDARFKRHGDL